MYPVLSAIALSTLFGLLPAAAPATAAEPLEITSESLWQAWPEERFVPTAAPCLRHEELLDHLGRLVVRHRGRVGLEEVGRSFLGRPIFLVTLGSGPRKVLLWSQMHGDEPSATPALLDLADTLLRRSGEPEMDRILEELTLLLVPMLNPDGTEVYDRRNAQGIDVNRDALTLATPEGRLLKKLRDEHEPVLGFNLHDQNRRTAVGDTGKLATNAVLAVAGDKAGTVTEGRRRSRRACAAIVKALAPLMPGGMARYDEDWSPRAFGDNVTAWGTPVVLIESGGLPPGRPFTDLTRLNYVALLMALRDLARDDFAGHDPKLYEDLPRNESNAWVDLLVAGGQVLQPGTTTPYRADLFVNLEQDDRRDAACPAPEPWQPPRGAIVDVGDGRFLGSGRRVDAEGALVTAPLLVGAEGWEARGWLDAASLDRLARLGVGTVRWQVEAEYAAEAGEHARSLAAPGRTTVDLAGEHEPPPYILLEAAPPKPSSLRLEAVLDALGGERWRQLREGRSLFEALMRLQGYGTVEAGPEAAYRPPLRRGQPASFLALSPAGEDGRSLEEASLSGVWLEGVEVITPEEGR